MLRFSELARPIVSRLTVPLRYASRMWGWELLSRLASDLGITVMGVQTAEGLILSRGQDLTVLPWLAKSRTYGLGAQNFVSHVRQLLANGGTDLDIAANLGVTTIPLGRKVLFSSMAGQSGGSVAGPSGLSRAPSGVIPRQRSHPAPAIHPLRGPSTSQARMGSFACS